MVRYAVECAQPALVVFEKDTPGDRRPAVALEAGRVFADGAAAHAARAVELARDDDPVVAEYGDGPPRVYRVEPLGTIADDPNVTDKRFPGNPTRSYRTTEPVRVVEEVTGWDRPSPEVVQRMRARMGELAELGIEAMDD